MTLRPLLALALAASITTTFVHAQTTPAAPASAPAYKFKTPKLNRAQLDALLARPEQLVIVDVRRPDELGRIGGFSAYLSIQAKDLPQQLAWIPRDRQLVTVSNHAGRAGAAADLLASKGFQVAGAVGAQDYEAEGGTLARVQPPTPAASAAR
jgi:rhodanese-related sulfurtransferase